MGVTRRFMIAGALSSAASPLRQDFFDGQTIHTANREIALTDILASSPNSLMGAAEPGAAIARKALDRLLGAGDVMLAPASSKDRWGRLSGALRFRLPEGGETTLQEALLHAGAVRVLPQSSDWSLLDRYFAAEDDARVHGRGIWALPEFSIRDVEDLRRYDGFQIYRGTVISAAERRGRIFFNFGDDFRTDVTGTVMKGVLRRWRAKAPLESYTGKSVEIRGFVDEINGPSIDLRHERQLRFF